MRYGWKLRRDLELSLVGQNLFDKKHAEYGAAPARSVGTREAKYEQPSDIGVAMMFARKIPMISAQAIPACSVRKNGPGCSP